MNAIQLNIYCHHTKGKVEKNYNAFFAVLDFIESFEALKQELCT